MAEREEDLGSDLREVEKEIEDLETVYLETTGSKVREKVYREICCKDSGGISSIGR